MTDKEFVLEALKSIGLARAEALQEKAGAMTGTELNAQADFLPDFQAAKAQKNMLDRPVGFVCRSTAGRAVKLLQPYDSDTYPQEPEELDAQWGFVWSTDPKKALPFIEKATSPYNTGECCTETGRVYRSKMDNNVWAPSAYEQGWEDLGSIEEVMGVA